MKPPANDPTAAEGPVLSDIHNPDNDPQRLLKLSYSLRYQLSQPVRKHIPTDQDPDPPGAARPYNPQSQPSQHQYQYQQVPPQPIQLQPSPPQPHPSQQLPPQPTSQQQIRQPPHQLPPFPPQREVGTLPTSLRLIPLHPYPPQHPQQPPYGQQGGAPISPGSPHPQQPIGSQSPLHPQQLPPELHFPPPQPGDPRLQSYAEDPFAFSRQSLQHHPGQAAPQQPQLPPLKGPGTKSGPYTGFASKAWLQNEIRQDVDDLRAHVDEYASKREHRAFDLERSALKAEIAQLRKRLAETEDKVTKLELMLPNDNGDFNNLRTELEELEKEADYFSDLYAREAKATKVALDGYRQAIDVIHEIENEFDRVRYLISQMPEPAQYTPPPPEMVEPEMPQAPPVCCGCIPFKRRK